MAAGAGAIRLRRAEARDPAADGGEADQYLADVGRRFAAEPASEETLKALWQELALWEDAATGEYLAGELSAVDLTVFPLAALFLRIAGKRADFVKGEVIGPRLAAWLERMQALPIVKHTWPPHWK
jgi:glutathione S-transferase